MHRTSRAGDPQLHTHCVVPNIVRRQDGRCVAIAARPLYVWARAAGSIYQAELQRLLSLRLGVEWQADRNNTREMTGFTPQALRAFSKRTVEIEAELEATGARYELPVLRMRADDEASLATRPVKDHRATPETLLGRWHSEAGEVGLDVGRDLDRSVCWRDPQLRSLGFDEIAGWLCDEDTGLCAHDPRFGEHDVIEHIAGAAAGRLTVPEINGLAQQFLGSGLVCRLAPKPAVSGWEPARWSTVAHRALEDDTLRLLDHLAARPAAPVADTTVAGSLATAGFLGDDQADAVRVLCGAGGSVRAVLAPAGYGKTAMAHTAAACAVADGRPVQAVATTAKAVAELGAAGLPARTIAAFRLDVTDGALPAGIVVILDEISQTSTRDAHTVLAALEHCPGGQLWILGDHQQAPAVKAGGIAADIDARADAGSIAAARLTVNRRQVDPVDRHALHVLRRGDAHSSQQIRREHGWEHTGNTPEESRRAMADAVTHDIVRDGPESTVALVVSHGQAEDLADRIRRRLATAGKLTGPSITGPGWTGDRHYQCGDRVLLHTRHGHRGSPLINGTVGAIIAVNDHGVVFRPDRGPTVELPAVFVKGTRADGTPNVSHAWARTVDGAQGGTWDHVHLLGTAALDAYRGYTAQSRSRQPTHTWNTATVPTVDHGGRLAHEPDPDRQVADALARIPDTSLAAVDDPWRVDTQLRQAIAVHRDVLDRQPPDRHPQLEAAGRALVAAHVKQAAANDAIDATRHDLDNLGALAGLTRSGRSERRTLEDELLSRNAVGVDAAGAVARAETVVKRLTGEQAAHDDHEQVHGWGRQAIRDAWDRLDQHWTDVALACVRADQPLAYGVDPLRVARRHLSDQLAALNATVPPDRSYDHNAARHELVAATCDRTSAQRRLGASQAELDQHTNRRWPRRDNRAIARCTDAVDTARHQLADLTHRATDARQRLDELERHQQARAQTIRTTAADRRTLTDNMQQLDDALDRTRIQRVEQLCEHPSDLHLDILGPIPTGPAGRAVWCHQAHRLEHELDHYTGDTATWHQLVRDLRETPELARIAEHHIQAPHRNIDPHHWFRYAERATEIHAAVEPRLRIPDHSLDIG